MRKMRVEHFLEVPGRSTTLYVALAIVVGIFLLMLITCALSTY